MREQAGIDAPALSLAEIESFDGGAWHLVFHYAGRLDEKVPVATEGNVAEAAWFPLDGLPDASEVAHHGWALNVLGRVVSPRT